MLLTTTLILLIGAVILFFIDELSGWISFLLEISWVKCVVPLLLATVFVQLYETVILYILLVIEEGQSTVITWAAHHNTPGYTLHMLSQVLCFFGVAALPLLLYKVYMMRKHHATVSSGYSLFVMFAWVVWALLGTVYYQG